MSFIRTKITESVSGFLKAEGVTLPVQKEQDGSNLVPPYVLVRVGSSEPLAPGQCSIHDVQLYIAVVHDADLVTEQVALSEAETVLGKMSGDLGTHLANDGLLLSVCEASGEETQVANNLWHHIGVYQFIVGTA